MKNDKVLKLAMDAGQIMLTNGAETYRVEDTMQRILENFELNTIDAFVTTTGIFCSVTDGEDNVCTMVRRISNRTINLEKVSLVNDISRGLAENRFNLDQAAEKLACVREKKPYKSFYKITSSGLACACFSYIFGGGFTEFVTAFIAGIILYSFIVLANQKSVSGFMINIMGGALVSLIALLFTSIGFCKDLDTATIGAIMPLVPGVGLTNAVRDVLHGDYLSGTSRIIDALLVAVCIATGVGIPFGLWYSIVGSFF